MKNRTKKILSGIALGVVGALTLTGCTSDLTFNQADLDNIINSANKYLEYQNNYSGEYAQNMLNDLLTQSKVAYQKANSYTIESSSQQYDKFGNLEYSFNALTQTFYNSSTRTRKVESMYSDDHSDNAYDYYFEISHSQNEYTCKKYDLLNFTYTNMTNKYNIYNIGYDTVEDYIDSLFVFLLTDFGENENCSNIILNTLGEDHYQFKIIQSDYYDYLHDDDYSYNYITTNTCYTIEFKDGILTKIDQIFTRNVDFGLNIETSISNVEFIKDTGDFNPITSNCTTEVPEEVTGIDPEE